MDRKERKKQGKLFVQKTREYEKRQPPLSQYLQKEYACENGQAEILVNLEDAQLYNPLSIGQQRELSGDIYEFIDEKAYPIPSQVPLKIRMLGVAREERAHVQAVMREHYDMRLRDAQDDMRINRRRARGLFVIGFLLMALYFVLANTHISEVWYEIFSIVATFVVWEAADYAILIRHDIRVAYYEAAQMALAEIEFADGANEDA